MAEISISEGIGTVIIPTPTDITVAAGAGIVTEIIQNGLNVLTLPPINISTSEKISKYIKEHGQGLKRAAIIMELFTFSGILNTREGLEGIFSTLVPEIICGAVPLYSVHSIERGMSDREVKYRATGDVFLAHQRGTTDSLRIDGVLMGIYRHVYLMFLLRLQNLGEAELKELAFKEPGSISTINVRRSDIIQREKEKPVIYESHKTFPIITQTAILLDMFLQTIEWHSSVEDGINVIKYTLLFRKHIEPKNWKSLTGEKNKVALTYDESFLKRQREEAMFDLNWKIARMGSELYRGSFFGGLSSFEINREAVSTIPYGLDLKKLVDGINIDLFGGQNWVPTPTQPNEATFQ